MKNDPYAILGVPKNATDEEIKSAYRKLAKKHHPDLNPTNKEAAAKFQEIGTAYALLSDKDKRAAFDRGEMDMDGQPIHKQHSYRDFAQGPQGSRYYNFNANGGEGVDASGFEDLFSSFLHQRAGGGPGGFGQPQYDDTLYAVEIDFLEAAKGGNKQVTLPDGRSLNITIPEGIEDGQRLRLKGQNIKGGKGQAADAYIEVHIRPHPVFMRKGQDVYVEIPVGFHESILESKVEIPTIHGPVEMKIPQGSSSGSTLRLKGKGIKQGDQYVKLKLVMPAKIDEELEQMIRQWTEKHGFNPRKSKEAAA